MVAVASRSTPAAASQRSLPGWDGAVGVVVVVGLGIRVLLGGGGVGDRSALVMATLLCIAVWLAARLLSAPRTAFLVTLGLVALLDLAALPARGLPEYDDREAFYRTDQTLAMQLPVAPGVAQSQPMLRVLVEPSFPASETQPSFGLAGDVNGTALAWDCAYQRGMQRLALPVAPAALSAVATTADVRLHLTGSPSRESEYLLVYASSKQNGFLVSLVGASQAGPATTCALR